MNNRKIIFLVIYSLFLLFFYFFGSTSIYAKNWYVRPIEGEYGIANGTSYKNAFDGFDKIKWGVNGVSPGDILYCCGLFSETLRIKGSGLKNNSIIIKKHPNHPFFIDGANKIDNGITNIGQDHLVIDNATISNFTNAGISAQDKKGSVIGFEIKNCIINNCKFWGVHIGKGDNSEISIHENTVYDCGDFQTDQKIACIGFFQWDTNHESKDITIYNNTIYNSKRNGGHKENGIMIYHGGQKGIGKLYDANIFNNIVYGFDGIGIQIMMNVSNIKCWNNLIYDCKIGYHFGGIESSYVDGAEIWATDPENFAVKDLREYPEKLQESVGLYSDDYSKNIFWHHLKVTNVPGQGLKSHNNKSAVYAYILTYGNGKHSFKNKSKGGDTFLFNCTLVHSGKGPAIKSDRGSKTNLKNCIVFGKGYYGLEGGGISDYSLSHTLIYGFKKNHSINISKNEYLIESNPHFSNIEKHDYTLKIGSPCIEAGLLISGIHDNPKLAKSLYGHKLNNLPDIGSCRLKKN